MAVWRNSGAFVLEFAVVSQALNAASPDASGLDRQAVSASAPAGYGLVGIVGIAASQADICPLRQLLLPVGVTAAVMVFVLVLLGRHARSSELVEAARSVILLPQFVMMVGSTIVVLDSFQLAVATGMAPGESGQLVGLNWLGAAMGFVLMWYLLRREPFIWREKPRMLCGAGLCLNIIGVLLYLFGVHTVESQLSGYSSVELMKGARIVGGFGQGLVAQFMVVSVQSLTSKADMGDQMTRVFFVNTVGIGTGPVIAAVAHALTFCHSSTPMFRVVPIVQAVLSAGALLGVIVLLPDISDVELPKSPSEASASASATTGEQSPGEAASLLTRKVLIISCTLLFILRCFVTSSVEVGSALLLERDFGLDKRLIGLAIGATFLAAIPLRTVHQMLKGRALSVVGQFRCFSCLALLGTTLLFKVSGAMLPGGLAILIADSIIFPAAFLSDGLSYGVLMQNVFPDGSLMDKNHCALWCNMLGMGVGRLSGAVLARWNLEALGASGQDFYAAVQAFACAVVIGVFEVGVRPGIKA